MLSYVKVLFQPLWTKGVISNAIGYVSICLEENTIDNEERNGKASMHNKEETYLLSSSYQDTDPTRLFCMTKKKL